MKLIEAIWMATAWAASEAALIRPISSAAALKMRHLEGKDARDRHAEPNEGPEARPVGPPKPAEQIR